MNGLGFLLIIAAFGFLWMVVIRPQRRRQTDQQRMLSNLALGDEVLTAGGVYGEVRELHEEELLLEIADGVEVRVARRAIAGVVSRGDIEEIEVDDDDVEVEEPEDAADEAGGTTGA